MKDNIRSLIVDDTAFMRRAVAEILQQDPGIEVIETAVNGLDCLNKITALRPDVITLDIDMPVMDGITAIRHIMIESPLPIVVLSSLVTDGIVTFEALRLGVVDFVPKPSGSVSRDIDKAKKMIIDRVKIACSMQLEYVRRVRLNDRWGVKKRLENLYRYYPLDYIVVIGTTLSGPNTVIRLLSKLSPTVPAAIVVQQEISPAIISSFVKQFNEHVPWRVEVAKDGDGIEQGACYICSNDRSLSIRTNGRGEPCLSVEEKTGNPLNELFSSAARVFRHNTIGILLSGIGDDGAEGLSRIKTESGTTMAKDALTCVYPNLTDNAIKRGVVDMVLEEDRFPAEIESVMR